MFNTYYCLFILRINLLVLSITCSGVHLSWKTGSPTDILGLERNDYSLSVIMHVSFRCPSVGADLQSFPGASLWSRGLLTCLILTFPFLCVLSILAKAWPSFSRHSELSGHFSEAPSTTIMMPLGDIHGRYMALFLPPLPTLGMCQHL